MKLRPSLLGPLFLLTFAALLFGCGGDDSTSPTEEAAPPLVSGTIDAGGGELVDEDIVLTVPAGALTGDEALAIYADAGPHPFGDEEAAVYRISGLPGELLAPATLRIRHAGAKAEDATLTMFLGEEREAYSGGSGLTWFRVAGRDSAGWAIFDVERGALPLGGKAEGDVQAAITDKVTILGTDRNRFEILFRTDEVSRAEADTTLLDFYRMYDAYTAWGFEFGTDESIWPLDIYIREPIKSIACYVTAPKGAGHFDIDPMLLGPGVQLLPVIAHEVLHCAQTFYDPRDPEEWGVLNQERLWLDEATAAYLEAISNTQDEVYPIGLDDDNYVAPLEGVAGHSYLDNANYGYGMSQFITYLVDVANPQVGEDVILELYRHFQTNGDVTDALDAEVSPPMQNWIVDFHRRWAENRIFPAYEVVWFWYQWPFGDDLEGPVDSQANDFVEIRDLGANLVKFVIGGDEPEINTQLMIEAERTDLGLPDEELPITVYGRRDDNVLERLATGTDQVLLEDWPTLYETYADILAMVSRPYSTAAGHGGKREIEVKATVRPDLSAYDVTQFTNAVIEVRTNNSYTNTSNVITNDLISIQSQVSWNGSALAIATTSDTFSITIDPETLVLGDWSGAERYTSIGGNWFVKRLAGHGVPLYSWDETGLVYRLGGIETCDYLTRVYLTKAADPQSEPYQVLTGYTCSDGEYIFSRSGIYLHLFRMPATNREK